MSRTHRVLAPRTHALAKDFELALEAAYLQRFFAMSTEQRMRIAGQFGIPPDWFTGDGFIHERHRASVVELIHGYFEREGG